MQISSISLRFKTGDVMRNNSPLFNPANVVNVVFWRESSMKNGKLILSIDELELLNFLHENGFGRDFDYYGQSSIAYNNPKTGCISTVSTEQIRDFVWAYICNLEGKITDSFDKKDLQLLLIKKPSLFSKNKLSWLKPLQNGVRHER